jgi:hypothetical protein
VLALDDINATRAVYYAKNYKRVLGNFVDNMLYVDVAQKVGDLAGVCSVVMRGMICDV